MTASDLLQELEIVPHHARILRMVELGRAAVHDPAITAMLAELAQGDFYQRFLALHACFGSYDSAHVLRALTDPSRIIRGAALSLSVLVCNDAQLRQALRLVLRDRRLPLLWKLHHHGKQTLIDEFLEYLAGKCLSGDPMASPEHGNDSQRQVILFVMNNNQGHLILPGNPYVNVAAPLARAAWGPQRAQGALLHSRELNGPE